MTVLSVIRKKKGRDSENVTQLEGFKKNIRTDRGDKYDQMVGLLFILPWTDTSFVSG